MAATSLADRLEVTARLGKGAFAFVYRGRLGEKEVAIKVLRVDPSDPDGRCDGAARTAYRLFCREAAVAKALGHHGCGPAFLPDLWWRRSPPPAAPRRRAGTGTAAAAVKLPPPPRRRRA